MARKGTITEGGVKIKWEQTLTGVKYADGKTAVPSPDNMDAKIAYKKAKIPNVISNPIKEYNISPKELSLLREAENAVFNLAIGDYSRCDFNSLHNVTFKGNGSARFKTGGRAIQFNGADFENVSIEGLIMEDINDYCIDFWDFGNVKYTGEKGSYIDGVRFKDIVAINCGVVVHIDGGIVNGFNTGVIKGLVIDGLVFKDSPEPRSAVYLGNGMDYDIKNCIVDNVNYRSSIPDAPQGAHNGIFQLGGNGKFHHNKITNHQGNAVRSWLFSQGETKEVEIFNNIVWNSSTYSAFELQAKLSGEKGFKAANSKVYNNTVGKMNTWVMPNGKRYFEGQLLDLYNTYGEFSYYNNLGFELNRQSGAITNMINFNGSGTVNNITNTNKYFDSWSKAVGNLTTFKSLHSGIGAL